MAFIRVTKEFRFEAAHALKGYDGPCRNIHGHSYILSVTIGGQPITDKSSPKLGMVMDFGDLKAIIKDKLIDLFDHALVLSNDYPENEFNRAGEAFSKVIHVDYQPTSENILLDFVGRIKPLLPANIRLISMKLRETSTSFAEWVAEENN